jgi:hypothetical protein
VRAIPIRPREQFRHTCLQSFESCSFSLGSFHRRVTTSDSENVINGWAIVVSGADFHPLPYISLNLKKLSIAEQSWMVISASPRAFDEGREVETVEKEGYRNSKWN